MKKIILGAALALLIAFVVFQKSQSARPVRKIFLCTWSNYFSDEIIQEFTDKTGIQVEISYLSSNEELLAKMRAGNSGLDVVLPSDYMVYQMGRLGMLAPLDHTQLGQIKHLDPYFEKLSYDPGLKYSVPFVQGTTGIAVNTAKVDLQGKEVSWALLFESPDPRHTSLLDDIREVFAASSMYQGRNLNVKSPEALQQAAAVIQQSKSKVGLFTSEPLPLLLSGEITIAHTYSTHGVLASQQDPNIKFFIPKEGATIWTDNFVVPAGSVRKSDAHIFINYFLDPENAAKTAAYNKLATPNLTARKKLPSGSMIPEVYPSEIVLKRLHFLDDLGSSLTLMTRLWTEVKS